MFYRRIFTIIITIIAVIKIMFIFSDLSYGYKRNEYTFSYEYLNPEKDYGYYKTFTFRHFNKINNTTTIFVENYYFSRKIEGEGYLVNFGAYKDWSENLYTYTSISKGTRSNYLPDFRIDNEFFFKTLRQKNLVFSLSTAYMRYYSNSRDFIVGLGFIYYAPKWNFTYKHLVNNSNPGSVVSHTDLFSLGIGEEKKSYLYLTYTSGNQAYLATYLPTPTLVNNNSYSYIINYRKWFDNNNGIILEYSYLKLKGTFKKNGFTIGFFNEY